MSALFATLTPCIIDLVQFNLVKLLQFRSCYDITRVYQQRKRKSAVGQGEKGGNGIIISTNDVPNG